MPPNANAFPLYASKNIQNLRPYLLIAFSLFCALSRSQSPSNSTYTDTLKYPKEYHIVKFTTQDPLIDTFDSYNAIFIFRNNSSFKSIHFSIPNIYKDSGTWTIDSIGKVVLNGTKIKGSFDVLKLDDQILLVGEGSKSSFIYHYRDLKSWYKKSKKTRQNSFKYFLKSDMNTASNSYHKRAEYYKWTYDQLSRKKANN